MSTITDKLAGTFFCHHRLWFNDPSRDTTGGSDMGDDKHKVSDKASEIARNIWLAGIGAYGRAVGEAQDRLEKAGVETPKLFRDLVKAGAALEEEARHALAAGHEARQSVEDRINRVRENFSLQRPRGGDDLRALHEKIDLLSAKVDALAEALALAPAPRKRGRAAGKAAPGKAPARKAAAKKRAGATAAEKKAVAGKKATTRRGPTDRGPAKRS
jgi:hypothetical protein